MKGLKLWQVIITNMLAMGNESNQFESWSKVKKALRTQKKCDIFLQKELEKWYYSSLCTQEFPPQPLPLPKELVCAKKPKHAAKQKEIFDQNWNKIRIFLPKDIKNELPLTKEVKQQILTYLQKSQKIQKAPISWTTVCRGLGYYYNYDAKGREKVKKWYHSEIFLKQQEQYIKTSFNLNNAQNLSSKLITVDINKNKQNLGECLCTFFGQIQRIVKSYTLKEILEYYHSFFNYFTSDFILTHCNLNHGPNGKSILDQFHNVHDLLSFKKYLESIPGLYPKLILWSIEHPFSLENSTGQRIKHHAMPCFLYKNSKFGFEKEEIETPYNKVSIPWIVHYIMHMIRAIEYGQTEDFVSVDLMLWNQSENTKKRIFFGQDFNSLKNIALLMNKTLTTKIFEDFPELEATINEKRKNQIQDLARTKMYTATKNVLTTDSDWSHIDDQSFIFNHKAQPVNRLSLKDFAESLSANYDSYLKNIGDKPYKWTEKELIALREAIGRYINGSNTKPYSFFCLQIEKSRNSQN